MKGAHKNRQTTNDFQPREIERKSHGCRAPRNKVIALNVGKKLSRVQRFNNPGINEKRPDQKPEPRTDLCLHRCAPFQASHPPRRTNTGFKPTSSRNRLATSSLAWHFRLLQ